jgi:hypothetical protein
VIFAGHRLERRRLEASLARDEEALAGAVRELRLAVAPRSVLSRHPRILLLGAAALGVWLATRERR